VLAIVAALVSLACVVASSRRLALAVSPTSYDPGMLLAAIRDGANVRVIRDALVKAEAEVESHAWERDLLDAACASDPLARGALIEEQVLEADWATERWARVPRVCASVATSAGFLCGALGLIRALGVEQGSAVEGSPDLTTALDALALGIVGTAFCVAVHLRARTVTRSGRVAVDRLVDRLRTLPIS
jgi:hypothetical protein